MRLIDGKGDLRSIQREQDEEVVTDGVTERWMDSKLCRYGFSLSAHLHNQASFSLAVSPWELGDTAAPAPCVMVMMLPSLWL